LPVLVLISRVEDRGRSALLSAALGTWLASIALLPALDGARGATVEMAAFAEFLSRNAPPPAELAGRAFSYVALTWLLCGAGLFPHVAAGVTVLFVVLLGMLQAGAATPVYGWIDAVIAIIGGILVTRWSPRR
jgi:hypothetical protein